MLQNGGSARLSPAVLLSGFPQAPEAPSLRPRSAPAPPMPQPSFRSTVFALAVGQLFSWAFLYFGFSSFVLPMQRDFGWSEPALMGAFTVGLAVWGGASYAVGAAIDHGRGRGVMTWGCMVGGAGFLLWSQAHSLWTVYAAWALIGAAMAMLLYEPAFGILAKRFPDRYRSGIATLTLFGGFGSTLSFTAVAWLIAHHDWRTALLLIGAAFMLMLAPLHAWALRGTESPGTNPVKAIPAGHDPVDEATLRDALRTPAFWLLTTTFTLYAFAGAGVWAHMMPALAAKGQTSTQALQVAIWFGPAQVLGRLAYLGVASRLHARASTHAMGIVVFTALALALTIFALADRTWALLVFAVIFGVANGLVTIVRGGIVPEYFGRAHVGRISGTMSAISLVTRASAPIVTAWALVALEDYRRMLLLLAALGAAAVVTFTLARSPGSRPVA